jgi:competence protein ComGC
MKFLKNKYGFTLVELIVIIAVSAIVLTPFSFLMTASLRNEVAVNRTIDAQHKTQSALIAINELARGAGFDEIEILSSYLTYGSSLRIGTKAIYLDGSDLKYRLHADLGSDTSSEVVLSNYINSITFVWLPDLANRNELDITINVDKNSDGNIEVFNYKIAKRE